MEWKCVSRNNIFSYRIADHSRFIIHLSRKDKCKDDLCFVVWSSSRSVGRICYGWSKTDITKKMSWWNVHFFLEHLYWFIRTFRRSRNHKIIKSTIVVISCHSLATWKTLEKKYFFWKSKRAIFFISDCLPGDNHVNTLDFIIIQGEEKGYFLPDGLYSQSKYVVSKNSTLETKYPIFFRNPYKKRKFREKNDNSPLQVFAIDQTIHIICQFMIIY